MSVSGSCTDTTDSAATTILNYKINKHHTVQLIPTLDELLANDTCSESYYTRQNFIEYLSTVHCLENLEFVFELNQYLEDPCHKRWSMINTAFLTPDANREINLPHQIRQDLASHESPDVHTVIRCKRLIYDDILFNLYNEFIRHVRAKIAQDSASSAAPCESTVLYRRKSEIISPDTITSTPTGVAHGPPRRKHSATDYYKDDIIEHTDLVPTYSRNNSASSTSNGTSSSSSRGSSIGSIMDSLKTNVDSMKLKNVRKFKFRRFSNDG